MSFLSYCNEKVLNESIEDTGVFKAIFMAGVPGAGKTTILTKVKSGAIEPRIVNVDKFTEFLNIDDILSVYDYSKQISQNQLVQYLNGVLPLFVDTTGANPDRLRTRLNTLDKIGYDYAMIFVNTSLDTALFRASKRRRKVEPWVIEEYYEKLQKYKDDVKHFFSFSMEINNNENELTDSVVLKAFKRISYFYNSEIENPIGQERYEKMKINGWKYLVPNVMEMNELKQITSAWYR